MCAHMCEGQLYDLLLICVFMFECVPHIMCLQHFFFSPCSRQFLMHLIYGTPAVCKCVCVHVCGSNCVVTQQWNC